MKLSLTLALAGMFLLALPTNADTPARPMLEVKLGWEPAEGDPIGYYLIQENNFAFVSQGVFTLVLPYTQTNIRAYNSRGTGPASPPIWINADGTEISLHGCSEVDFFGSDNRIGGMDWMLSFLFGKRAAAEFWLASGIECDKVDQNPNNPDTTVPNFVTLTAPTTIHLN